MCSHVCLRKNRLHKLKDTYCSPDVVSCWSVITWLHAWLTGSSLLAIFILTCNVCWQVIHVFKVHTWAISAFFVSIGAFISCDYSHMKTKVWDLQNNSQQLGKKANEQIWFFFLFKPLKSAVICCAERRPFSSFIEARNPPKAITALTIQSRFRE